MATKRPIVTGGASGTQELPDADSANFPGGVSAGTASAPHASAMLDVVSTTKGFGQPSMTTTQRLAIASPREGLEVYDSDIDGVCVWDTEKWYRKSQKSAPTIAAGTGAGTSPTISINGTDLGGTVTLTTGTSPVTAGILFTITFDEAFEVTPKGIAFVCVDFNSKSQYANYTQHALSASTCGLTMNAGRTIPASSQHVWTYIIIQ